MLCGKERHKNRKDGTRVTQDRKQVGNFLKRRKAGCGQSTQDPRKKMVGGGGVNRPSKPGVEGDWGGGMGGGGDWGE